MATATTLSVPDFEQIARLTIAIVFPNLDAETTEARTHFAESLRRIWNARGAADIAQIDADRRPYHLVNMTEAITAIRKLDR